MAVGCVSLTNARVCGMGNIMIRKLALLHLLARHEDLDAASVAYKLGSTRAAAGMLLLRLTRHGLLQRALDPDDRLLFYHVTEKGQARLAYLTKTHEHKG